MTATEILTFSGALLLMVITPGPGVLACVSRAITSGLKPAAFVVLGIISGDIIFVLMALYGLSAIAETIGGLFAIVRYLGAAYLIYQGYRTWTSVGTIRSVEYRESLSSRSCYVSGLFLTLGNPKAIMFYLSFLPAFLDLDRLTPSDIATTLAIVLSVLVTVLFAYSLGALRLRAVFDSRRAVRMVNRCSGGAMITAGVVLAVKE